MRRLLRGTTTALALVLTMSLSGTGQAATQSAASTDERVEQHKLDMAVESHQRAHPDDLLGLDAIVREATGRGVVFGVNELGPMNAEEAQDALDSAQANESTGTPQLRSLADFPVDSFVTTVALIPLTSGTGVTISGSWNWRDDFVGQGDPFDIASLQFRVPECVALSTYRASAATFDGTVTTTPGLRDSGLSTGAAIWNVNAYPSGFVNQADNGTVSIRASAHNCPNGAVVDAAFTYEANKGGSILGVSAGWGGLSVSYSNPGMVLQLGTEPVRENVLMNLETTSIFYSDNEFCSLAGVRGVRDGSWKYYRCVYTQNGTWELFTDGGAA